MALTEYLLRLQKGITGGFAPPTPSAIYGVSRGSGSQNIMVAASIRPDGTPHLQDMAPKELEADDKTNGLVDELYNILKKLPTEKPVGSEDIYGMDTGIMWRSEDLEWCNGGPQGCGGGESTVKASASDKEKFKRAVAIVEELTEDSNE